MLHLRHSLGYKWQNESHRMQQWCIYWHRCAQMKVAIDTNGHRSVTQIILRCAGSTLFYLNDKSNQNSIMRMNTFNGKIDSSLLVIRSKYSYVWKKMTLSSGNSTALTQSCFQLKVLQIKPGTDVFSIWFAWSYQSYIDDWSSLLTRCMLTFAVSEQLEACFKFMHSLWSRLIDFAEWWCCLKKRRV